MSSKYIDDIFNDVKHAVRDRNHRSIGTRVRVVRRVSTCRNNSTILIEPYQKPCEVAQAASCGDRISSF